MNNAHHANGKSTILPAPMFSSIRPPLGQDNSTQSFAKVLNLVQTAVSLELQLKTTMTDLDKAMKAIGQGEIPSVLVSLMQNARTPQVKHEHERPTVVKAQPKRAAKISSGTVEQRIMNLLSDKKDKPTKEIVKAINPKNPNVVHTALSKMVREGQLVRPKFATYRLKSQA